MRKNGQGAFLVAEKMDKVNLIAEKWTGRILGKRKTGRALRPPKNA